MSLSFTVPGHRQGDNHPRSNKTGVVVADDLSVADAAVRRVEFERPVREV